MTKNEMMLKCVKNVGLDLIRISRVTSY